MLLEVVFSIEASWIHRTMKQVFARVHFQMNIEVSFVEELFVACETNEGILI